MIYLDNSATTRPFDAVVEAMAQNMREAFYNPSSLYAPAMGAAKALKAARATLLSTLPGAERLVFTGSGTEADNFALLGTAHALRGRKGRFVASAVEHPAVLETLKRLEAEGHQTALAPVDGRGLVDVDALADLVDANTTLVSVMHINNEVGAVQPLADIARAVKAKNPQTLFMVDGVQGYLRQPMDMAALGVDLYTLSAHKIHGPKGVGALALSARAKPLPLVHGGGQEAGLRSGTENMPGIEGLATAVRCFQALDAPQARMQALKCALAEGLLEAVPGAVVNGPRPEDGAPHVLNIAFPLKGEVLLHALEAKGVLVSTGSACSSHKRTPSHVLTAMGLSGARVEGALRFSLSPFITEADVAQTVAVVGEAARAFGRFHRR